MITRSISKSVFEKVVYLMYRRHLAGLGGSHAGWKPAIQAFQTRPKIGCRSLRRSSRVVLLLALGLLLPVPGCTYSGGELLFMLGFGKGKKIEAQFSLSDQPILILIDDDHGLVDWPIAKRRLSEALTQELLKHKAAVKIIPEATLQGLRQSQEDFETLACDTVGRRAGAEQVIWLKVEEFFACEDVRDLQNAAVFTVAVKVISTTAKKRTEVRLWPDTREGRFATVNISGAEVSELKTRDAISKTLADRLAEKIAKFFYEHRLGDFEKEQ